MIPLAILTLLQLADIYTTHRILTNGGRENNPLLAKLFAQFGHLPVLIVTKLIVIGAVVYADYINPDFWQITIGLVGLYAIVVYNNWRQMTRK